MKKLYFFHWDCGRDGDLYGLFIADDNAVKELIGQEIHFGEVLGKHSEIGGTLAEKDVTVKSDDPGFIERLRDMAGNDTIVGYNPFDYCEVEDAQRGDNKFIDAEAAEKAKGEPDSCRFRDHINCLHRDFKDYVCIEPYCLSRFTHEFIQRYKKGQGLWEGR